MSKILDCVRNIADKYGDIGFEGIVLLNKDGEKLYERRWIQDYPRDIYSNTKSFTSAAVGMAIFQNKLSLDAKVLEIFEVQNESPFWDKMCLKDLLTMRSGFGKEYLMYFDRRKGVGAENYLDYLLSQEVKYEPGSRYLYSTGDSILAGCMVEKVVGVNLHTYLYKNLLLPLGIDYPIWETDLQGHTCGGSGLQLKLIDMAKLGLIYLNEGVYQGIKFFDKEWVDMSFSKFVELENKKYPESYGFFGEFVITDSFIKRTEFLTKIH